MIILQEQYRKNKKVNFCNFCMNCCNLCVQLLFSLKANVLPQGNAKRKASTYWVSFSHDLNFDRNLPTSKSTKC